MFFSVYCFKLFYNNKNDLSRLYVYNYRRVWYNNFGGGFLFTVNMAGHMVKGTDTQRIFRPHGSGDWLFLYFPVPMKFYLSDKTEASSEKDACVIYAPHDYHSFGGFPHFQNSYVHFSCSDDEIKKFSFRNG